MVEMDNFYIGLRKVDITRNRKSEDILRLPDHVQHQINVGLRLEKDKKKIFINVFYRLSPAEEPYVDMYIEFIGHAGLNIPFDPISDEDIIKSPQFKKFVDVTLSPKILEELDRILPAIYNIMNVEYKSIIKKGGNSGKDKNQM